MKPQTGKLESAERERLVARRKAKNMSVEFLAECIGIHAQTLYRLEAGKRQPLKITLRIWRTVLDGSAAERRAARKEGK